VAAGCARPNIPGVYTRVLAHMNWVVSKMMLEVGSFQILN
jgi:secreted trypsin-like serine protease